MPLPHAGLAAAEAGVRQQRPDHGDGNVHHCRSFVVRLGASALKAPTQLAELLAPAMVSPALTLLVIALMLLILGTFMDMAPLILITTPIFLPIATAVGMDPVQFGVMLMLALGIGLLTPPVGSVLFVGCAAQNIPIGTALRTIWPFYLALLVALALVMFVPALTLWLPAQLS